MDIHARPFRSVLYLPASNRRALDKARTLPADAIIFDLEDAVAPGAKEDARSELATALRSHDFGARTRVVRVNGLDTPWARQDLAALAGCPLDAILLPKVGAPEDMDRLRALLPDAHAQTPLWAMLETPLGVLNVGSIARAPGLAALVLGTNDLAKDIGARFRADRGPLMAGLQMCLLAARAHGLLCIDGVYNSFRDQDGLARECEQGRDLGFDGKTLIHPAQLEVANRIFAPTEAELDLAQRQIKAYEAAEAQGSGIAVVDGQIVENLHIDAARRTLQRMDAINSRGEDA